MHHIQRWKPRVQTDNKDDKDGQHGFLLFDPKTPAIHRLSPSGALSLLLFELLTRILVHHASMHSLPRRHANHALSSGQAMSPNWQTRHNWPSLLLHPQRTAAQRMANYCTNNLLFTALETGEFDRAEARGAKADRQKPDQARASRKHLQWMMQSNSLTPEKAFDDLRAKRRD